ncbi:MAG: NAD(P)-dependent oxidoreductase [Acidimicrobiales bacterium]
MGQGQERARVLCLRPASDFADVGVDVPEDLDVLYVPDERAVDTIPPDVGCLVLPSAGHPLSPSMFDGVGGLRLVQFTGAGFDRVPVAPIRRLGAVVCNIPGASAPDVAGYVVIATGWLLRRLGVGDSLVRLGHYEEARRQLAPKVTRGFRNLRVGIVGLGSIGLQVARAFDALGATVRWFDVDTGAEERAGDFERLDLPALIEWSEVLTLHVPLVAGTAGLLGKEELALLPRGAIVVNASRGGVVDEVALADGLESGRIGGAVLDVFEREPLPASSPLRAAAEARSGTTILTPHIAGVTREASRVLFQRAWANVHDVLVGERTPTNRVM